MGKAARKHDGIDVAEARLAVPHQLGVGAQSP